MSLRLLKGSQDPADPFCAGSVGCPHPCPHPTASILAAFTPASSTPHPQIPLARWTSARRRGADTYMLWKRRCVTCSLKSTDLSCARGAAFILEFTGFLDAVCSSAEIFA